MPPPSQARRSPRPSRSRCDAPPSSAQSTAATRAPGRRRPPRGRCAQLSDAPAVRARSEARRAARPAAPPPLAGGAPPAPHILGVSMVTDRSSRKSTTPRPLQMAPYGAICSGRGVVLFRLLRSVTMDTPSICGAGGAPPANGGGAAGLAARRASERALAAGASESWAHRPRGGRRLPGARVAAVLCAELGGASHLDLEGRGERRACDGGGIAPAHEPPRAARRPAPQLHRAAGVAAGRERYLEPAHEPAGGLMRRFKVTLTTGGDAGGTVELWRRAASGSWRLVSRRNAATVAGTSLTTTFKVEVRRTTQFRAKYSGDARTWEAASATRTVRPCLLYTSDAADE